MNILNFIFINFTSVIVLFAVLLNFFEPYLPNFISQSFRYGKHCHKGHQNGLINWIELPKSFFKHFYAFALFWSLWGLYLIIKGIILKSAVPEGIMYFFDLIAGGKDRPVLVDSTSALIAMLLISIQCLRRFYETWSMQIFSKSKINISHYLVGYFHYFCAVSAILANTEGFVRLTTPSQFSLSKITIVQYIFVLLFHMAWREQYKANKILVNLRKTKDGKIESEKHAMPVGGTFELISSPHMFFEIVMYLLIWGIIPGSTTWGYCVLWVAINQIQNAWLTQKWYLTNFSNYPKQRRAIIPFVL